MSTMSAGFRRLRRGLVTYGVMLVTITLVVVVVQVVGHEAGPLFANVSQGLAL